MTLLQYQVLVLPGSHDHAGRLVYNQHFEPGVVVFRDMTHEGPAPAYRPRPADALGPAPGSEPDCRAGTARLSRATTASCPPEPGGPGVGCRPGHPGPADAALVPARTPDP
jgi:hypothetical protein